MHNHTYICPKCHNVRRINGLVNMEAICQCQAVMIELDHRWRVPEKNDLKGWKQLQDAVNSERQSQFWVKLV